MNAPTNPLPVRLGEDERALVEVLAARYDVPVSTVMLRCVRLLGNEVRSRGRAWNWIEATAEFKCPAEVVREAEEIFAQRAKRAAKTPDTSAKRAREEVARTDREAEADA